MKLVVSIATRGRPERLIEALQRTLALIERPETAIAVAVDADDTETITGFERAPPALRDDKRIVVSVKPREDTIAEKWNRALEISADCYVALGDDDPIATQGFDGRLLEAAARFPDGIGMVYGHMANASFSGVVCPTRKLCDKMGGKIFPEYFPYWFCDHWTDDVAKVIGRISFADVRTDQSKPGKTQEMREPGWWATWFDAAYLRRREQAHAIINDGEFDEPAWRKDLLRTHHPLIEYRSRWVNDHVRAQARQLEQWSGTPPGKNERYQRVRDKAAAMIPALLEGMPPDEAARFQQMLLPPTTIVGLKRAYG